MTTAVILAGYSLGGLYAQAFARLFPRQIAGLVLIDATSPLEPPGLFVRPVPPPPGTQAWAEEAGVEASMRGLLSGPPLPSVPLVVIAATDHSDTPAREALWSLCSAASKRAWSEPRVRALPGAGPGRCAKRALDRPCHGWRSSGLQHALWGFGRTTIR
jgi:pimeloyl-ACP methyl ester carboxylesterase